VALRGAPDLDPRQLASARYLLARAMIEHGDDRAAAIALAKAARAAYAASAETGSVAEIDAWIAGLGRR
jgi:hypothetical protein